MAIPSKQSSVTWGECSLQAQVRLDTASCVSIASFQTTNDAAQLKTGQNPPSGVNVSAMVCAGVSFVVRVESKSWLKDIGKNSRALRAGR
jgi:hypothetical protein